MRETVPIVLAALVLVSPVRAQTAAPSASSTPAPDALAAEIDSLRALYGLPPYRSLPKEQQDELARRAAEYLTNGAGAAAVPSAGPAADYFTNGSQVLTVPTSWVPTTDPALGAGALGTPPSPSDAGLAPADAGATGAPGAATAEAGTPSADAQAGDAGEPRTLLSPPAGVTAAQAPLESDAQPESEGSAGGDLAPPPSIAFSSSNGPATGARETATPPSLFAPVPPGARGATRRGSDAPWIGAVVGAIAVATLLAFARWMRTRKQRLRSGYR